MSTLSNPGNEIDALGAMAVGGALDVTDAIADSTAVFTLDDTITADSVNISNTLGKIADDGSITTTGRLGITLTAIGITQSSSGSLDSGSYSIALDAGGADMDLGAGTLTSGSTSDTAITLQDAGSITLGSVVDISGGLVRASRPM